MLIKLNETYKFKIDNLAFGELSKNEIIVIFKDGRNSSSLLSKHIEKWFPSLTCMSQDNKGYDFIDSNGIEYECKSFTENGATICQSSMHGGHREFDEIQHHINLSKYIYMIVDIVNFPEIKIIFKNGIELSHYKNGKIPFKDRDIIFNNSPTFEGIMSHTKEGIMSHG
jgi:hypothetical protein